MKTILGVAAAALVAVGVAVAADIKSGPQAGQKVPGPFHPLNVTGEMAGQKHCLFCQNGENPVAMIFARESSPELAALIKKIDAATVANKGANMGSFVVFLSEKEGLEKSLAEMAKKEGIKACVLSIDNPAGPKGYEVSKDADITVVLYTDRTVKANYAFAKGKMTEKDVEAIVADVSKIVKK